MFLECDMVMMTALQEIKLTQRCQEQHIPEILTLVSRQPRSPPSDAAHIADVTSVLDNVEFPLHSVQAMQVLEAKLQDNTAQK